MPHRLDNHEERISALEQNYGTLSLKINDLERGQLDMKNTLLTEFSSTKSMLNDQNAMNQRLLEHMYGIQTTKITSKKDIILGLVGGGGIVGVLIGIVAFWEQISNVFGG